MSNPSDPLADLLRQREITQAALDLYRSGQTTADVMSALLGQFPGTPLAELVRLAGEGQAIAGPQAQTPAPIGSLQPLPAEGFASPVAGYRWAEQDYTVRHTTGAPEDRTVRVKVYPGDSIDSIADRIAAVIQYIRDHGTDVDEVETAEITLIE